MSLIKKLAGETALYGLSSILGRLLNFIILIPYLTYSFEPEELGIQTDIYAWSAFLIILFTYRMETAFFRFGNKKEQRSKAYHTASRAVLVTSISLVAFLLLCAQPIANLLEYPQHPEYIQYFAFILGFDALSAIPFARLRLEGKALKFATIKLSNLFINLGAVFFFLEFMPRFLPNYFDRDIGIAYVFLANLIASCTTFLLLLPSYFKKIEDSPKKAGFDATLFKEMLFYALPLVLSGFAGIVNEVLDRNLLKYLLEGDISTRLALLGIYGACYKISIFMNLFTQAFNYAAEPFFFRNADRSNARQLYADVCFIFLQVGCLGFLGIMLFMDIVQYFVAAPYREGLSIVPILLLANLCLGLYYNIAIWYKISNKTQYGAYISLFGATVTVAMNFVLIPLFIYWGEAGYLGSAWATLICYASMLLTAYLLGQKHYPVPYRIKSMLLYLLGAIGMYLLISSLQAQFTTHHPMSYLLAVLGLGGYVLILALVDGKTILKSLKQ